MEEEIEGIVTSIENEGKKYKIALNCGDKKVIFLSEKYVEKGKGVKAKIDDKKNIVNLNIEDKVVERVERIILNKLKLKKFKNIELKKIESDFELAAKKIFLANELKRKILVRYHADADGIASALILKKIIKADFIAHFNPIYSLNDALRDLEILEREEKPILIILDFGSGEDSYEALKSIKDAKIDIISIDHHPFSLKTAQNFSIFINPWKMRKNKDLSTYTTGYLCSKLAEKLSIETGGIEKISLAGDKSSLKTSEDDVKKALVLDFVAAYKKNFDINFFEKVFGDKELFTSILYQAETKLEEIKDYIKKRQRIEMLDKYEIVLLPLDGFEIERNEFPNKGKIVSLASELREEKNYIVIGITKNLFIIRISDSLYNKGIGAKYLIEKIRKEFGELVINAGGHEKAASIKVNEGYRNIILNFIREEIKKKLGL